jgi:hypothetical protein
MVRMFMDKPIITKRVPWYHTKDGVCAWLTQARFKALTGVAPEKGALLKIRLEVVDG